GSRDTSMAPGTAQWLAVAANALAGGTMIGWTIENIPVESLGAAGWLRSLAMGSIAVAAPVLLSVAITRGSHVARLAQVVGPRSMRERDPVARLAGALRGALLVMSFVIALALVFDPRYRDFPFAPLTAAVVPFVARDCLLARPKGMRSVSECA